MGFLRDFFLFLLEVKASKRDFVLSLGLHLTLGLRNAVDGRKLPDHFLIGLVALARLDFRSK